MVMIMIMINCNNDDDYVDYVDDKSDDTDCWLPILPKQIAIFQYFDDEDDNGEWRKW